MATVTRFEDLEIWKLARAQANDLFLNYTTGNFSKDFELSNQINGSSGSVMNNIAVGFSPVSHRLIGDSPEKRFPARINPSTINL